MKIRMDSDLLAGYGQGINSCSEQVAQAAGRMNIGMSSSLAGYRCHSARPSLKYCRISGGNVAALVASYRNALRVYRGALSDLAGSVSAAAQKMEETEQSLLKKAVDSVEEEKKPLFSVVSSVDSIIRRLGPVSPWNPFSDLAPLIKNVKDAASTMEEITDLISDGGLSFLEEKIDELNKWVIDSTSVDGKAAVDGELKKYGFVNEYGEGNLVIGAYSGNAEFHGALFDTDSEGNLRLNPAIAASIGVSVCAFHADVSQEYNIVPGVKAGFSGNVDVGKLDANASINAGLMKDGKLNPTAKVEADLQATLVEASAEGHVNVAGIEGSIEAGIFVGAGAHIDAGIEDGVLTFDMGVGLGVGANVSFSMDCSGLIDAASSAAESAMDFISDVGDVVSDAADTVDCIVGCVENILSWF